MHAILPFRCLFRVLFYNCCITIMRPFFACLYRYRYTGKTKAIQPLICPAVSQRPFLHRCFPCSEQQLWEKQMAADWGSFVALTLNTLWKRTLSCSVGQRNQGRRFMAGKRSLFQVWLFLTGFLLCPGLKTLRGWSCFYFILLSVNNTF